MFSTIYYIGGPMDLTKKALSKEPPFDCEMVVMTHDEHFVQTTIGEMARGEVPAPTYPVPRHIYKLVKVPMHQPGVFIALYQGLERR